MQAIQNWCYTIFAGVLFSGIVLLLTPSERFRPLMQLLLGAFLLVCIFTWCRVHCFIPMQSSFSCAALWWQCCLL